MSFSDPEVTVHLKTNNPEEIAQFLRQQETAVADKEFNFCGVDDKGLYSGPCIGYRKTADGEFVQSLTCSYENGVLNGPYHEDGSILVCTGYIKNGKWHGEFEEVYKIDGRSEKGTYVDGRKHGIFKNQWAEDEYSEINYFNSYPKGVICLKHKACKGAQHSRHNFWDRLSASDGDVWSSLFYNPDSIQDITNFKVVDGNISRFEMYSDNGIPINRVSALLNKELRELQIYDMLKNKLGISRRTPEQRAEDQLKILRKRHPKINGL